MLVHDTIILASESAGLRRDFRGIFEQNYNILEAASYDQLRTVLSQNFYIIAAIMLDIKMCTPEGKICLVALNEEGATEDVPIISVVEENSLHSETLSLDMGADDIINYPFHAPVVKNRVANIVSTFYSKRNFQNIIDEQSSEIHKSYEVMVDTLSAIIEHRSVESGQHVMRIRRFTKLLLEEVARACPEYSLDKNTIMSISSAAALHDIGKISIPDNILNKPERLTEEEFEIMKTHTVTGSSILEGFRAMGNEDYLRYAYNICRYHHERYDGMGYPDSLKGEEIPICAQVVGLVDVYDALTTDRVYKKAIPYIDASNMIINGECGAFSPKLLECFKHVRGSFETLARSYADGHSPVSDAITVPLSPPKKAAPDSLQEAIVKYRAMLHHFNVTAMEVDVDTGVFHLLYDPYLDFSLIRSTGSFGEAMSALAEKAVHPDDRYLITDDLDSYLDNFFKDGLRKSTRKYRIKGSDGQYRMYEATILRTTTGEESDRKALLIWHRIGDEISDNVEEDSRICYEDIGCGLTVRFDKDLSFTDGSEDFIKLIKLEGEKVNKGLLSLMSDTTLEKFTEKLSSQLSQGNSFEVAFPIEIREGEKIFFIYKGNIRYGKNGIEVLSGIAVRCDITAYDIENTIKSLNRYRNIIEKTNDILFEIDLTKDELICSQNFDMRFGYRNIHKNAMENLFTGSHIHPDDLDVLKERIEELKYTDMPFVEANIRIADKDGRYIWNRIRATAQRDDLGNIVKGLGIISDIDTEIRRAQMFAEKSEKDSLTKLYNKEAGHSRVKYYLSRRNTNKCGALILIDLDNFKVINDRYGHLFGDTLIANVSSVIGGMFRENDTVARIGGDEFMAFMADISDRKTVSARCNELINAISSLYGDQLKDTELSCSVGVALVPDNGTDFSDLYQKADIALYRAKSDGKACYRFYDSTLIRPDYSEISKHIDSDERLGVADNSLTEYIFQRLYETSDIEATVNSIMELIGKQLNVSRVYVFENNDDNSLCSNTFEWCNDGVEPQIDVLQDISYKDDIDGYIESYDERGLLYCSDVAELPENIRNILEPQGIRAMLHCAIKDKGIFRGYVGLDDCTQTRLWTKEQISMLLFLSQIISTFILKERAQKRSDELNEDMRRVLESQFTYVYVVEDESYKIRFFNGKVSEICGDIKNGEKCYKALMGRDSPCEKCPIKMGENKEVLEIRNDHLGVTVKASASPIRWKGKKEWILTCAEQDK